MRKLFSLLVLVFFLASCSNQDSGEMTADMSVESYDRSGADMAEENLAFTESADVEVEEVENKSAVRESEGNNRKVIYTADLQVEVESYQEITEHIQKETERLGGYIVESNLYNDSDGRSGQITVRIPQEDFRTFIEIVEKGSTRVVEQTVSGQDVTEEFVDLESRLKSKRQVEERLLEFLTNAEKTEDLLKISNDLADIQEEIETLIGRMNYLQDKTDFSTVTIRIYENNVTLSSIDDDDLNTWEETKKQFMRSVNFVISVFSGIIVFFIGNLPVFLLVGVLLLIGFLTWRRKRKSEKS